MHRRRGLHACARLVSVALLLLGFTTILERTLDVSASQVSGTNYTSPNYGYTITWQLPWYVVEDEVDASGFDELRIADSRSEALFIGGRFGYTSATSALHQFEQQMEINADYVNFRSVDDPQCSTGEAAARVAAACYRADITYSDGSQGAIGVFLKAWAFGDGVTLLMRAFTEEPILLGYIPHWNGFGVYEKGSEPQTPTSDCSTESHHGIEFCFDLALSERDRSDIVEGVRLGQNAIATILGDHPVGSINVTGLNAISPSGDELIATTYGDAIAVYAGSTLWQSYTPIERIESVIHEYFHVFQNLMTDSNPTIVPLWFTEGSAESFGYMVASQIGVTDQAEFYSLGFLKLTQSPVAGSLRDLGTGGAMGADEYPLAYMAVQYLLGSKGMSVESLAKVYQEIEGGSSFDAAFAAVFGMSLDQFYADFDSWRLSMSKVYSLDDDFYPNDGPTQGAFISWKYLPQYIDRDGQLVFVAQTSALADCNLTLNLAGQSIQRTTWANGQGEIFWLVSLPDNAVVGNATVNADCGGVPISSTIVIS